MIEKNKMYMVWQLKSDAICPVYAYSDNGKVIAYHHPEDREIQLPNTEQFFNSESDAKDYLAERIQILKMKAIDVKKTLENLYNWERHYDSEDSEICVEDFLTYGVCQKYIEQGKKDAAEVIKRLAKCARTHVFEAGGISVPMDKVDHIEWQDRSSLATIVLDSGIRITTKEDEEYDFLSCLYDHNDRVSRKFRLK